MGLLYTFTLGNASSAYELYVAVLRFAIAAAVALSVLVSLDRILHVLKCLQVSSSALVDSFSTSYDETERRCLFTLNADCEAFYLYDRFFSTVATP